MGQATCNDALKLILKGGTVYTNCPTITLQPCLHSEGQCLQGRRNSLASGGLELATSLAMPSGVLGPRGEHLHRSSRGVCKPDHVAKYCRHFFCHLTATATVFPRCMHADVYGFFVAYPTESSTSVLWAVYTIVRHPIKSSCNLL